jgi:hypothetical protein
VQPTLLAQPATWAQLFGVVPCHQRVRVRRLPAARLTPTISGMASRGCSCSRRARVALPSDERYDVVMDTDQMIRCGMVSMRMICGGALFFTSQAHRFARHQEVS